MAGDDTTEGSRPLSNDDFRRLLATPRPGTAADDAGRKRRPKPHKAKSQPVPEVEQSLYRWAESWRAGVVARLPRY